MGISSFPPEECTRINDNIFIQRNRYDGTFQVWLQAEHQYFAVGMPKADMESAKWSAEMLDKALGKIVINIFNTGYEQSET